MNSGAKVQRWPLSQALSSQSKHLRFPPRGSKGCVTRPPDTTHERFLEPFRLTETGGRQSATGKVSLTVEFGRKSKREK